MAGVVAIGLCTLMLGIAMSLFLCQDEIARTTRTIRARTAPPPVRTGGRAIEDVARALRRLRPEVMAPAAGTTMARRRGAVAAYDDLLLEAARALDVPDTLSQVPDGTGREAERLRLEHLLREAGLVLDRP